MYEILVPDSSGPLSPSAPIPLAKISGAIAKTNGGGERERDGIA